MSDTAEILLEAWAMYNSNPLFWIIVIPFVFWWWNFLKKQFLASGAMRLISSLRYYAGGKLLNRRTESRLTVTPSPKSSYPFKFWKEIILWPILMTPFVFFIASSTVKTFFSLEWWSVFGSFAITLILIFGMPVHIVTIVQWIRINNTIKAAILKLRQLNIHDNGQAISYLEVFIVIADDLRMGLDPRVLPMASQPYKVDVASFLNELVTLNLVKTDRKTERDTLAHRYYLTRSGATLVWKEE